MIKATNLFFSYGDRYILEDAQFSISPNSTVGLVGPNGAGKSTLFKLLKREERESGGKIEIIGNLSHVPQEIKADLTLDHSKNVRDYVDPEHVKEDFKIEFLLRNLELNTNLLDNPKNLSGGQKTRLSIARALITQPDLLLLDEPTNFLDVKGTRWVMNFLKDYPKTLIVISHDLALLDEVIDKVLFLNPHTHKVEEYKGNYSDYLKKKKESDALLARQVKQQKQHIRRMEEGFKKIQNRKSEKGVRQMIQLKRRIERLKESLPQMPREAARIQLQLPDPAPVGELPFNLKNIYKYFDSPILEDVSLYIERGERLALIGPNGAGKSTLIKIIMKILTPDSGEVRIDPRAKIGYYSQEFETFDQGLTPYDLIDEATDWGESRIRPFLTKFLFQGSKIFQKIRTLSGGEKTRLAIALLVVKDYNLLLLDEPTTYLDPLSQRVILEGLKEYNGSILIVSHTRDFIRELAPNRVFFLPENKIEFYTEDTLDRVEEV